MTGIRRENENKMLREVVADRVRRDIIEGRLSPGDRLSERSIAAQWGVSTTPIKEAFRILQTEGLLVSVPRKGSFVSASYRENVLQMIYLRGAMEGTAACFAAMSATEEEMDGMEQALLQARRRIEGEEEGSVESCSDRFHEILRRSGRNEYLINLLQNMRSLDSIIRTAANEKPVEESRRAWREHWAILTAIRARDGEQAEKLMQAHIRRVGEGVMQEEH